VKVRTGEEMSELKELTVIMTIPFPFSSGVQEQTDDWPRCWTVDQKITNEV
jgi:hypothetical protein